MCAVPSPKHKRGALCRAVGPFVKLEKIRALLDGGAPPDDMHGGMSAIVKAAISDRKDIVELLFERGATISWGECLHWGCISWAETEAVKFLYEAHTLQQMNFGELIERRHVERVRMAFNRAFCAGRKVEISRQDVRAALLNEDREMLKLLMAWGATITMDDVKKMPDPSKHDGYVKILRACGMRFPKGRE